jgi:hypothetical protein
MQLTSFSFPTNTLFGIGAINQLEAILGRLGVRRPLVVTDQGFRGTEAFGQLVAALGGEAGRLSWVLFADVHANPVEGDVRAAAATYVAGACDGVVAIGGGSPLDAGKAARLLVKRPGFDLARASPRLSQFRRPRARGARSGAAR